MKSRIILGFGLLVFVTINAHIPEEPQEYPIASLPGLPDELVQEIAYYLAHATSEKEAINNLRNFAITNKKMAEILLNDIKFIRLFCKYIAKNFSQFYIGALALVSKVAPVAYQELQNWINAANNLGIGTIPLINLQLWFDHNPHKIMMTGLIGNDPKTQQAFVARFTINQELDPTFADHGILLLYKGFKNEGFHHDPGPITHHHVPTIRLYPNNSYNIDDSIKLEVLYESIYYDVDNKGKITKIRWDAAWGAGPLDI